MRSRYRGGVLHARWRPAARPLTTLAVAALLTGCAGTVDVAQPMPPAAAPESDPGIEARANRTDGGSHLVTVTGQQRAYLDALRAAGVTPSDELIALSIGSYVCQARAARQSDQALWDFVVPLVRNDIGDRYAPGPPPQAEVDATAAQYIRIAAEQLC